MIISPHRICRINFAELGGIFGIFGAGNYFGPDFSDNSRAPVCGGRRGLALRFEDMTKRTARHDAGAARKTQVVPAARGRGRPSTFSEETAEYIVNQMIEHGRALVAICDDDGMPARATVYRWLGEDRAFAARVDAAREAIADHAVWEADQVVRDTMPETANADRIKLIHWHWKAAKMGPGRYGDRRTTELTGPKGGPVQLEQIPVVLDASTMSREDRDALRALLLAAQKPAVGKRTAK